MIFIIGGRSQGKTGYALKNHITADKICDGADMDIARCNDIACIDNFHLLVKRITEAGADPIAAAEKIYAQNPDIIIISTEIGGGIVPMERAERLWREAVGRTCCYVAAHSEKVIRMICGIPTVIKETAR